MSQDLCKSRMEVTLCPLRWAVPRNSPNLGICTPARSSIGVTKCDHAGRACDRPGTRCYGSRNGFSPPRWPGIRMHTRALDQTHALIAEHQCLYK